MSEFWDNVKTFFIDVYERTVDFFSEPLYMWIGIGVGALLLVGILVLIVFGVKRSKRKKAAKRAAQAVADADVVAPAETVTPAHKTAKEHAPAAESEIVEPIVKDSETIDAPIEESTAIAEEEDHLQATGSQTEFEAATAEVHPAPIARSDAQTSKQKGIEDSTAQATDTEIAQDANGHNAQPNDENTTHDQSIIGGTTAPEEAKPARKTTDKQPAAKKPTANSDAERPATAKQAAKPGAEKPATAKTAAKPATEKPATAKSDAEKPAAKKAAKPVETVQKSSLNTRGGKWVVTKQREDEFVARLYANNGELLLESEIYAKPQGAKNGIDTIKKNVLLGNFGMHRDKNGNYFYKLKSGTNRLLCVGEVYSTKSSCESAIESVKRFSMRAPTATEIEEDLSVIEYIPKDTAIVEAKSGHTGKWQIKQLDENAYVACLYANNGELLLASEDYSNVAGAKGAIETIKKNAFDNNFIIDRNKAGKFCYKLRNAVKSTVCVGEVYEKQAAVEQTIESVKRFCQTAILEEPDFKKTAPKA